eukprot:366994-Pyramimonas_sp.AAC.1
MGATTGHSFYTKLADSIEHGTITANEGDEVTIFNVSYNSNNDLWARGTITQTSTTRSTKQALKPDIITEYRSQHNDIQEKLD